MSFDLEKELAFYRKYHYNQVNVIIHVFCIPLILFTALSFGTKARLPLEVIKQLLPSVPIEYGKYFNLGVFTAVGYSIFYTLLDIPFGLPSIPFLTLLAIKLTDIMEEYGSSATKISIGIHVVSWIAQFIGHGAFEHRAPALLDSLVQALVLAPFFVVFEVAHFFGFRKSVIDNIDEKIRPEVEAFHNRKNK